MRQLCFSSLFCKSFISAQQKNSHSAKRSVGTQSHGRKLGKTRMATSGQRLAINLMVHKEMENASGCTWEHTDGPVVTVA